MPRKFIEALKAETASNSPGALLSVSKVRRIANMPKHQFDAIAIAFSREGIITLTEHDAPMLVSDETREQMVHMPFTKRYFNGIYLNR